MEGFFSRKETESKSRPDGRTYSCISCGLFKHCSNPKMLPYGNFKKGILNIGEAPGEVEDRVGKPFQGKSGKLLQKTYKKLGIDLFEDCLNVNAVLCRPKDNETPTNYHIECCRRTILKLIEDYKPKVIILLGNSAVYSLIGHRWKKNLGGISKWRGWTIPDQDFKTWICPTFHPSYIERSAIKDQMGVEYTIWEQDLKQAFSLIKTPIPIYKEPEIEEIEDLSVLDSINEEIAFDYETTGIKPHAIGHRIICCSIATSEDHAYVFMMPKTRKELIPFIRLLENPLIPKIAQNMKFEHTWSLVRLKTEVNNWAWDTMLASHIIDNRPEITGLKFQTYVQFGVVDYSSEVDPFIHAGDSNNANSFNKIMALLAKPRGRSVLLKYCAYDAINEYRLAKKQRLNILPF